MTRFAWLQARTQTLVVLAALAALAVTAAITGVHLSHLYNSLVEPCQTRGNCELATGQFLSHDNFLQHAFDLLTLLAPALLGIFWGAPLLGRELETGTYRLAWTQGVTRSRWLLTKLALVGMNVLVVAGLLTWIITWWYRHIDHVGSTQFALFDRRDIAPVAYALFAFALAALLGAVFRRTLPAMATTLGVFAFARIATTFWMRPNLQTPLHKTVSLLSARGFGFGSSDGSGTIDLVARDPGVPNAWVQSSKIVTSSGHLTTSADRGAFLQHYCPTIARPPALGSGGNGVRLKVGDASSFEACRNQALHLYNLLVTYQPANRYWTFQWLESAIFLGLAGLAVVGCYWWITRRNT